jgi:hypothetical protein
LFSGFGKKFGKENFDRIAGTPLLARISRWTPFHIFFTTSNIASCP